MADVPPQPKADRDEVLAQPREVLLDKAKAFAIDEAPNGITERLARDAFDDFAEKDVSGIRVMVDLAGLPPGFAGINTDLQLFSTTPAVIGIGDDFWAVVL